MATFPVPVSSEDCPFLLARSWFDFHELTRNEPRGKDSLLKKQGQENWPPTQKNIREGHPLGYRTEIELNPGHGSENAES